MSRQRRASLHVAQWAAILLVTPLTSAVALAQCPAAALEVLTPEQCAALLAEGEFFFTERLEDGSKDTVGVAAVLLDAPPESVWRVVTDNDNFEQFICSLAESDYDPVTGINRQVLRIPAWFNVEYRVRLVNSEPPNSEPGPSESEEDDPTGVDARRWRSAWSYVDGGLETTEGAWSLAPHDGGTLVLYQVVTDPGFLKRRFYSPARAEAELRKLLAEVSARVADPDAGCP